MSGCDKFKYWEDFEYLSNPRYDFFEGMPGVLYSTQND